MNNPLLEPSQLPFGAPQFDKIELCHFKDAAIQAAKDLRKAIDAIDSNPDAPTFENTIKAKLIAHEKYANIASIYRMFLDCKRTKELVAVDEETSLESRDIMPNSLEDETYFNRVQQLYKNMDSLDLSAEEQMILVNEYDNLVEKSRSLSEKDKAEYKRIYKELDKLTSTFRENCTGVLKSTIHIEQDEDISGIPDDLLIKAKGLAESKGLNGWMFSFQPGEYGRIMSSCKNRNVRKRIYKEHMSMYCSEQFDNSEIIKRIVEEKIKLSNILGFKIIADSILGNNMLNSTEKVHEFLDALSSSVLKKADIEDEELLEFAIENGFNDTRLEAWDNKFWNNILSHEKYSVDHNHIRQYLPLNSVLNGIFKLTSSLYGITFVERNDLPVYDKLVRVFEVREASGEHIGLLFLDLFQREDKIPRTYTTQIRSQSLHNGTSPIVLVVTNLMATDAEGPVLLSIRDLEMVLHEFGHAIHKLFSKVEYATNSCRCKERDFIEFPAIFMEQWAYNKDFLKDCSSHYITKESLPVNLIDRLIKSHNFGIAASLRYQIKLASLDMAWAELTSVPEENVLDFEKKAVKKYSIERDRYEVLSHGFTHIFSGGYAAGYYSYILGLALAIDTYSMFMNPNNDMRETANRLRKEILEKGCTKKASEMYFAFAGHYPTSIVL